MTEENSENAFDTVKQGVKEAVEDTTEGETARNE
jgi:hypothetical protein